MPRTRIHYIVNARLPHTRAYGIQIAKMCEAFIEAGVELTLVVPNTRASQKEMRAQNGLRVDVPTVILPGLDWYDRGRAAFALASLIFMVASFAYLLKEKLRGRLGIVYTVDMDTFSYLLLPILGALCFAEMHSVKRATPVNRFFFKRATGIIATNSEIKYALTESFSIPHGRIIVEPNGVDPGQFKALPPKRDARRKLSLPPGKTMALYVGRFYKWKGLGILADTCKLLPDIDFMVVGGTREDFQRYAGVSQVPDNLHIAGESAAEMISTWLAAADVLLVLGTKTNEQSYRFTAPMKIYEYMAADRPIVASATPALRSFVGQNEVFWYEPDNAASLNQAIRLVLSGEGKENILKRAHAAAAEHTWAKRVSRTIDFMRSCSLL